MITVLCATLGQRLPQGLEYLGGCELHLNGEKPWAVAANQLLDKAAERGGPALFLDDDIELTEYALSGLVGIFGYALNGLTGIFGPAIDTAAGALPGKQYPPAPDVVGFTLCNGAEVVSAGFAASVQADDTVTLSPVGMPYIWQPFRCAHVTASCMWLSERAVQQVRFPVWPGQHHEDVAFTLDAWLKGLTVAYVPGLVFHHMDMQQKAGATKSTDPAFAADRAVNAHYLQEWIKDHDIAGALRRGVIPMGAESL
ncbi:MAG: glycosyltransferase family 2 protein [Bradyrhizobium sp.]|uniref:glycosyltransferase family 2 protein n=1 Tax=Bradyrhizobium sp. TaxID=376 RepID=UPI003D0B362D